MSRLAMPVVLPAVLLAVLLTAPGVPAATIFFPEEAPTDICLTRQGLPGRCVSALARRCALYPTVTALLTSQPRVCRFIANDPIICCPVSEVLPDTLGELVQSAPEQNSAGPALQSSPTAASLVSTPTAPAPTPAPTAAPTVAQAEPITQAPPSPSSSPAAGPSADVGPVGCGLSDPEPAFLSASGEYSASPPGAAVQLGDQPWTALVGLRTVDGPLAWLCGGALVSERVVATAAHCAVLGGSPDRLAVRLGEHDLGTASDGAAQDLAVVALRRHPAFRPPSQRHNVALLLLDRPVNASRRVRPICLPEQDARLAEGTPLSAPAFDLSGELTGSDPAGHGRLASHPAAAAALATCQAPLEQLPHAGFIFPHGLQADSELCVARPADVPCTHDSGGPLVAGQPARLVGLRLLSDCQPDQPEVAVRVSHYVDFIHTATNEMLEELKAPL